MKKGLRRILREFRVRLFPANANLPTLRPGARIVFKFKKGKAENQQNNFHKKDPSS